MGNNDIKWIRKRRVNSPFVYNISMFTLNFLPRKISHWIGHLIAIIIYILHRTERIFLQQNLSILTNKPPRSAFIKKLSFRVIKNFIISQIDLLKSYNGFIRGNRDFVKSIILINKQDFLPIESLLSLKRGLILITGHIGLWELGGIVLKLHDYPVTVITYKDSKDVLEKKNSIRSALNIRTVTIGEGRFESINIVKELRSGSVIALLMDRPVTKYRRAVELFGHKCFFSTDMFLLAKISKSPVLPTFIVLDKVTGKYRAIFGKPLISCDGPDSEEAVDYFNYLINLYKNTMLDYNEQWYNFYPFFEEL